MKTFDDVLELVELLVVTVQVVSASESSYSNQNNNKLFVIYNADGNITSASVVDNNRSVVYEFNLDTEEHEEYKHIQLDLLEDLIDKAFYILSDLEYDDRVMISLDLTEEEHNFLLALAQKENLTLDDLIVKLLQDHLDQN